MLAAAETHYSAIAARLIQGLPSDFAEAAIYAELEEGTGVVYICRRDRSGQLNLLHDPRFSGDLYEIIEAFRKAWVQSGSAPWSVLSFSLQPSGKFSADFGYDDVADYGALDQRFSRWQSRTFPGETLHYDAW